MYTGLMTDLPDPRTEALAKYIMRWLRLRNAGELGDAIDAMRLTDYELLVEELVMILDHVSLFGAVSGSCGHSTPESCATLKENTDMNKPSKLIQCTQGTQSSRMGGGSKAQASHLTKL